MTKICNVITVAFVVALISVSWLGSAEAGLFGITVKQVIQTPLGSIGAGADF